MNYDNYVNTIISASGTGLGTIAGWVLGRKKRKAEINKNKSESKKNEEETREIRITNLSNTIDIYEKVFAELKEQLQIVSDKCTELANEITSLREENVSLKQQIHQLTEQLKEKIKK